VLDEPQGRLLGQRACLGVTDAKQQQWERRAFEAWRSAMEGKDVLVFMVPHLALAEMRGTARSIRTGCARDTR
jgi:hypothetical protein